MIPIRDDTPRYSRPYITYFLIALNLVIYFFEWQLGMQGRGALNSLVMQFGVIPRVEIGLLTGTPVFSPVGAMRCQPGFVSPHRPGLLGGEAAIEGARGASAHPAVPSQLSHVQVSL